MISVNLPAPSLVTGERDAAPRGNLEQWKLISFSELPFLGTLCVLADRQSNIRHPSLKVSLVDIPWRKTTAFVTFYVTPRGVCFAIFQASQNIKSLF